MKGQAAVIKELNARIADELTAINQYIVQAEMSDNWGYTVLNALFTKIARMEMKHMEMLIQRILFLEGTPEIVLKDLTIGSNAQLMHMADRKIEQEAVDKYNQSILVCENLNDRGTRELLQGILKEEEEHLNSFEGELSQIEQMGLQNYLAEQIAEE